MISESRETKLEVTYWLFCSWYPILFTDTEGGNGNMSPSLKQGRRRNLKSGNGKLLFHAYAELFYGIFGLFF